MIRQFLIAFTLTLWFSSVVQAQTPPTSKPTQLSAALSTLSIPNLPPLRFDPPTVTPAYITPAQGILSSSYGWRWGRMHQGIDIAAAVGTPVRASASGTVEFAGWNTDGYGNLIEIRHGDGSLTSYAHLDRVQVQRNEQVTQGQVIGEIGSTGYSTGPHLHFEIHLAGQGAVNPVGYLGQNSQRLRTAGGLSKQRS